ncbi:MAG: tetratricopeptide repeat protein [Planctomycetes bacterium]|nr:tetratricopeptide repeat protein [Planctomycetota bacterium]
MMISTLMQLVSVRAFGWMAAGALIAAVSGGCAAAGQQRRASKQLMAAGDYDRAVEVAQQAVSRNPRDAACLDALSDAETAAAEHYYEQANKLMSEHRLGEARKALDKALGYMPAHPGANSLTVAVDKAIGRGKELANRAREAAAREDWEQAIAQAGEAVEVDQDSTEARELLAHARSSLVAVHLARGQAALDAGDAEACLAECERAAKWDPSNALAAGLQKKAQAVAPPPPVVAAFPSGAKFTDTQPAVAVSEVQPMSAEAAPIADATPEPAVASAPAELAAVAPPADGPGGPPSSGHQREDTPARRPSPESTTVRSTGRRSLPGATFWSSAETRPAGEASRPLIEVSTQPAGADGRRAAVEAGHRDRPERPPAPAPAPISGRLVDATARRSNDGAETKTASTHEAAAKAGTPSSAGGPAERKSAADRPPPKHLYVGTVSRDNSRYKKVVVTVDGISVKVKDTDRKPLDADLEIVAGKFKVKPDDVPVGAAIKIQGVSGRLYKLTVLYIIDADETVGFAIDSLD